VCFGPLTKASLSDPQGPQDEDRGEAHKDTAAENDEQNLAVRKWASRIGRD